MSDKSIALKLLVIDDTPQNLELVAEALAQKGLQILTASDPEAGFELFLRARPQIVLLDLVMSNVDAMELLERIAAADPGTDVILMTGHYSPESAVEAIQKGACDYLTKPLDLEKLRCRIRALLEDAEKRQRALQLDRALVDTFQFEKMIGRSPLILETFARIRRVAPHYQTVLVSGATGTGKELVARALHRLSPRASGPFVVCNCSALVETLLESELFGYVRGAFTGATQDKIGIFEQAHGGTVFLDEIGELSAPAQAKLLRVLQQREVQRVGSPTAHAVDVRVIGATNRQLRAMVADGQFRDDLYYRLAMVEISLPRLVDRKEDLPLLQKYFVERFANQYGKQINGITRRAQLRMAGYSWPGNIRELENVIGNAAMMTQGNTIDVGDLPEPLAGTASVGSVADEDMLSLHELQNRHVARVLERVGGNKARAAEILGISRTTIYEMLSKMNESQANSDPGTKAAGVAK
ncbi:MAG TPA: sigma-54 dependent transcriptional regulator [Terriglobales bacterium]|nr:sigma-54 dependent transcriptional regulator [Terriglobales bacterium]